MKKIISIILILLFIFPIFPIDITVSKQSVQGTLKYSEYKTKQVILKTQIIAKQDSIITAKNYQLTLKDNQLKNNDIQIINLKEINKILLQQKVPKKYWYENPRYILPIGFILGVGASIGLIQATK